MARNQAARKAAKAIRRRAVVAAKRGVESTNNGLNGQIRQAAELPILDCLISDGLFTCGMGYVALIRGVSRAYQHVALFMVDSFCLGVKDTFFRSMDRPEAERIMDAMQLSDHQSPIAPAEARKLLHDLISWAADSGFPPHADYARFEPLFGDVAPAETDYTPRFGYDGKVLYVPGPMETPAEIRRRVRMVRSRLGDAAANQSLVAVAGALASEMELATHDDAY